MKKLLMLPIILLSSIVIIGSIAASEGQSRLGKMKDKFAKLTGGLTSDEKKKLEDQKKLFKDWMADWSREYTKRANNKIHNLKLAHDLTNSNVEDRFYNINKELDALKTPNKVEFDALQRKIIEIMSDSDKVALEFVNRLTGGNYTTLYERDDN